MQSFTRDHCGFAWPTACLPLKTTLHTSVGETCPAPTRTLCLPKANKRHFSPGTILFQSQRRIGTSTRTIEFVSRFISKSRECWCAGPDGNTARSHRFTLFPPPLPRPQHFGSNFEKLCEAQRSVREGEWRPVGSLAQPRAKPGQTLSHSVRGKTPGSGPLWGRPHGEAPSTRPWS